MPHSINWFPWCDDTFRKASLENKPILMYLTAHWCGWCAVMEDTTYQDPQVINMVEENFIPMKVNVDQYPHVADRYHFGGYPSVVFLAGDGQILKGENYLPGDQMKSVLAEVLQNPQSRKKILSPQKERLDGSKIRPKPKYAEKHTIILPSLTEINKVIADTYDGEFGGFFVYSQEMKFPFPEIIDYLFAYTEYNLECSEEVMLKKTLHAMVRGEIYDHRRGGFFRLCDARDWTLPHAEKLLENNAALVRNYLMAFHKYGLAQYGVVARDTMEYLIADFFDREAHVFGGSRIGKEIDDTPFTNWNSVMISSLILAHQVLGDGRYLDIALQVEAVLWSRCYRLGRGMSHFYLKGPSEVELLSDQIKYIMALYDAYICTEEKTHLQRAQLLMRCLEKNYRLPGGDFSDIPLTEKNLGYLKIPLVPFVENIDIVLMLIKIARLLGSRIYSQKAGEVLKSLSGMIKDNPIFAAKYGQGLLEMENYRVKDQIFS